MSAVINAFVDEGEQHVVLLYRRPEDGKLLHHLVPADFVLYLRTRDVTPELRRQLRDDPFLRGYVQEGAWLRTRWRGYNARKEVVQRFRDAYGIDTFEGDLNPTKRWMADHPAVGIQKPRRCWLDLETDSRVPIGKAKKGEARVLVWCLVGEDGREQHGVLAADTDIEERRLLAGLYEALQLYDQVCAWNGDEFDFPIVKARMRERKLDARVLRRWLWLDHLALYRRMNLQVAESGEEKQSFALNAVAQHLLGAGKDPFDARYTYREWEAGGERRETLVRYCIQDTDLCRRIEEATGYIALHQTLCELCGLFPDSWALRPTAQMDGYLLRLGKERGVHFPTLLRDEEPEERVTFAGAYVKHPPEGRGILRHVHVCDFASMYPSIMVSWNMSPDTKRPGPVNGPLPAGLCRAPKTGVCFDVGAVGIIPAAVAGFMSKRKEFNALRAAVAPGTPEAHELERWTTAYKVAPNSFFGAQGNPGCRFHDRAVAESISTTGAWLAEQTEAVIAERLAHEVVYVDTDGLWVVGPTRADFALTVKWLNEAFYPTLLARCGCKTNVVKIAYEKEFERVVFTSAKRYVGRFVHYKGSLASADSRPEIKGLEYKRGDVVRLAREMQAEVIDLLVGGLKVAKVQGPTEELRHYEEACERWRARVANDPLTVEDVQLVKGVSREMTEYATRTKKDGTEGAQLPHLRVAKILAARGEYVGPGVKIAYVLTDGKAKPLGVIPACNFQGECDRRFLWEAAVWPPTERLLVAAFPGHDWSMWRRIFKIRRSTLPRRLRCRPSGSLVR